MSGRNQLRVRIGADEEARLDAHCAASGQTRTQAINWLLGQLPTPRPAHRMSDEDIDAAVRAISGYDPHVVYTVSNSIEAVYVGCTNDLDRRLGEHRRRSWWWPLGETVEATEYPNGSEAFTAERDLIRKLSPVGNTLDYQRQTEYEEELRTDAVTRSAIGGMIAAGLEARR